jgi:hypothetical protein
MDEQVRISAVIMAHPSRASRARRLRDQHPELGFGIVTDPDPGGTPSALRTARVAWGAADDGCTHHLVVQDDAVLSAGFAGAVRAAAAARPDDALCLFTEWGSATSFVVRLAALAGYAWAEIMEHYAPAVAAVLPTPVARAFATDHTADGPQDDVMGARRSACFGATPGELTGPVLEPSLVPYFSWTEGHPFCSVRQDMAGRSWRRESPRWFLGQHGLASEPVIRLGQTAISPLMGCGIPPIQLFGLWTTAFGLGLQAATLGSGPLGISPRPRAPSPRCRTAPCARSPPTARSTRSTATWSPSSTTGSVTGWPPRRRRDRPAPRGRHRARRTGTRRAGGPAPGPRRGHADRAHPRGRRQPAKTGCPAR